jgi:hypothetical protein
MSIPWWLPSMQNLQSASKRRILSQTLPSITAAPGADKTSTPASDSGHIFRRKPKTKRALEK